MKNQQIKVKVVDDNKKIMEMMEKYLIRLDIPVEKDKNILKVNEIGASDLLDFSQDHLQDETVEFQLLDREWKSIDEINDFLEAEWIDEVINNKHIHCHYQPIVTRHKEIYAYELLARFKNEDGTIIYPNEIFEAANNRGRIYALDRLCRMTAVRHATKIVNGAKAFINFIPTSIYAPEFCLRSTTSLAKELNIDTADLVFEVVETEQVEDVKHLKSILHYYRERGFQYALDDVGAGYNTIDLLADLSPRYMKLDMQYVQGVAEDKEKQIVALKFLEKAEELGATSLAEGIENEQDFIWLKQKGYQLFQGYYFGKPEAEPKLVI
ncbi:EAL domain-containing protein [Saliterribacillus persicus]|nr:EAL domain-containing protein [Saliterribacillus persicus]